MPAFIVLSLVNGSLCSVSDICVRLYSLYQDSGGPEKLNPISVLFRLCLWMYIQCCLSSEICSSMACLVLCQPVHEKHVKRPSNAEADSAALLYPDAAALTLPALCETFIHQASVAIHLSVRMLRVPVIIAITREIYAAA